MAIYIACCKPDGTCESLGPCGPGYDCTDICNSMGGAQFGGATVFADACGFYYGSFPNACGIGQCLWSTISGGPQICEEISYAECVHRSDFYQHAPGVTCPTVTQRNRQIKAFMVRERAWPYRAEWALAASGTEFLCFLQGLPDGQLLSFDRCQELGGTWAPTEFVRERGTHWPWYLDTNYQSPEAAMQMARMFLDRRVRCWNADYTDFLPFSTKQTCIDNAGHWRWDGIPYLAPAPGHIFTEIRDCVKRIKLFQQLGFWYADDPVMATGCYNNQTFAPMPQYGNESQCVNAGHLWRVGAFAKPPLWSGQVRYSTKTPNNPAGDQNYFKHSKWAEDYPHADEFQYMVLLPVTPLSALPPDCCSPPFGPCVPYCGDNEAHNKFPFTDTRTYEIPCYTYNAQVGAEFFDGSPYRNRSFGDELTTPTVPAGLRAIVGYSPGDARVGSIRNYCGSGCPQDFDCEAIKCEDLWENIYRKYSGITGAQTYKWEDDTEQRGWAVTYQTIITAWFVQDTLWDLQPLDPAGGGQIIIPSFRWNTWYEGETKCIVSGNVDDPAFRAWILTHDSGFGIKFGPRYEACNDVLAKFEGMTRAMGDEVYPSSIAQNQCRDYTTNPSGDLAPCANVGKLSTWYRPTVTGAPEPQQGLIHETQRRRYLDPTHDTHTIEYGWATIAFSTLVPQLVAA